MGQEDGLGDDIRPNVSHLVDSSLDPRRKMIDPFLNVRWFGVTQSEKSRYFTSIIVVV